MTGKTSHQSHHYDYTTASTHYDYIKGGTDIVDQKMEKYLVKPKSSKWTVAAFSHILNIVFVNAATLSRLNNNKTPKMRKMSSSFLV